MFLLPLLLQIGLSAFASGTITFATAAGSLSMKITALRGASSFRNVIIFNGLISAIAMCAFFTASMSTVLFVLLLIAGFFQSLQFTATQAMTYADVEQPLRRACDQHRQHDATIKPLALGISDVAVLLRNGRPISAAFGGATAFALASVFYGWVLPHDAAAEVSGHRPNVVGRGVRNPARHRPRRRAIQ